MSVDVLLSRLDDVAETRRGWRARCPAHKDRKPSLSIAIGDGDRVLLHDHAGCRPEEVLGALGLSWADLKGGRARRDHPRPTPADPIKAALVDVLARERRRRKRLALSFEMYGCADLVRALYASAAEAHRLAERLGPDHADIWEVVAISAKAQTEAAILEAELDAIDLRRSA